MTSTLRENPSSTADVKPSDTLLRNFRATLEDGWKKFDAAVPSAGKSGVFASDDYAKMKSEYESAITMLATIQNDDGLRSNVAMRQKLDETIRILRKHNADSDKEKAYNAALVEMETRLADLQKDVEKNNTILPAIAVTASAGVMATDAMGNITGGIAEVFDEGANELSKEVQKIKKNPLGKVAELLGFTESSILSDFKEALAEKKSGGFDGFIAGLKIWFYGIMAKWTGTDLAKGLTPEEMKLAGIQGKPGSNKPEERSRETIGEAGKNILYGGAYSGLISFHQSFLAKITGEKNPDENKRKIQAVYAYQSMYNLPYEKAQSLYVAYKGNPNSSDILKELNIDSQSKISPKDVVAALALIVDESLMSTKALQKNRGTQASITVGEILTASHGDWSIASDFEKIDPTLSSNPSQVFSQIFGNIGARFSLKKEGNTYRFGNPETEAQAESLGMSAVALGEISTLKININTLQESEIEKLQMDPKTADILKKLISFWKSVKGPLAENFSFGQKSEYLNFYNTADIAPVSLLKLYLVTGGSPDVQSMASPRKMGVYAIIRESFFDGAGANKDFGAAYFDKSIIAMGTAWALNPTDLDKYIPKDVQEAMGNISATIADNVVDSTWGIASRAWMALPTGWKIGAGASVTLGIMIIWRLRALKWIGMGAALGAASAASLFAGAVYAGLSDSDKKKYPKDAIEKGARGGMEKILAKTE